MGALGGVIEKLHADGAGEVRRALNEALIQDLFNLCKATDLLDRDRSDMGVHLVREAVS